MILACECGKRYRLTDSAKGRKVRCKTCGRVYRCDSPPVLLEGPASGTTTRIRADAKCPICRTPLVGPDPTRACDKCGQGYHAACWETYEGCATYGCAGAPEPILDAQVVDDRPAPTRRTARRSSGRVAPHVALLLSALAPVTFGLTGWVGGPLALVQLIRHDEKNWVTYSSLALSGFGVIFGTWLLAWLLS